MDEREKIETEIGSHPAPETFFIKVTKDGPYLVYGKPPIDQEIIVPNGEGSSWEYRKGKSFTPSTEPVALCRCGHSKNKPFCDGCHIHVSWDPNETSSKEPLLEGAVGYDGPTQFLADNEKYCAFARFCDAYGKIWNLVTRSQTKEEQELVRHEAEYCPSGRLVLFDKETNKVYEPPFSPSIGLIEDPVMKVSGPIWVKGGIRIESADGESYEIRNRVTLCRCGMSSNKPFCNGAHASVQFRDGLYEENVQNADATQKQEASLQ